MNVASSFRYLTQTGFMPKEFDHKMLDICWLIRVGVTGRCSLSMTIVIDQLTIGEYL